MKLRIGDVHRRNGDTIAIVETNRMGLGSRALEGVIYHANTNNGTRPDRPYQIEWAWIAGVPPALTALLFYNEISA
jgi:hypothetical protein